MKRLLLLPVGDLDERLLGELAPALQDLFRVPCERVDTRLAPEFAYHRERQQFHSGGDPAGYAVPGPAGLLAAPGGHLR